MKYFMKFCIITLLLVAVEIVRGFTISKMWSWFIVPLGAPSISIFLGMGIAMIADLFMLDVNNGKTNKKEIGEVIEMSLRYCVGSFVLMGLGAIVHLFV